MNIDIISEMIDMYHRRIVLMAILCCCISGSSINANTYIKIYSRRSRVLSRLIIVGSNLAHADRYASFIGAKSPAEYDARAAESNFQTSSSRVKKESVPREYCIYKDVRATEYMPALSFELTSIRGEDGFYYPRKLVIKMKDSVLQEFNFDEDAFAPCTLPDIGLEYGDFAFNGYGGFRILSTSMGQNPSYYYWMWDRDKHCFAEYEELEEMIGYTTFDYNNKVIHVAGMGGADYHEFMTYKYMDDKLTLIEKAIDTNGYRKIYKMVNKELELIEIIESPMF